MARNFKGRANSNPKLVGRGTLENIDTDGPHNDWVGMPPYYIHHLSVDSVAYSYLSPDKELEIELGKKVTFRYKETAQGKIIDKRSLGIVIDPSELT